MCSVLTNLKGTGESGNVYETRRPTVERGGVRVSTGV